MNHVRVIFHGYVGLLVGKLLGIMLYPVVGSVKLEYPLQTPPWVEFSGTSIRDHVCLATLQV